MRAGRGFSHYVRISHATESPPGQSIRQLQSEWFVLCRQQSEEQDRLFILVISCSSIIIYFVHLTLNQHKTIDQNLKIMFTCRVVVMPGDMKRHVHFIFKGICVSLFILGNRFKCEWEMCILLFPMDLHLLGVIFHMALKHNALRSALNRQLRGAGSCPGPKKKERDLKIHQHRLFGQKSALLWFTMC